MFSLGATLAQRLAKSSGFGPNMYGWESSPWFEFEELETLSAVTHFWCVHVELQRIEFQIKQ